MLTNALIYLCAAVTLVPIAKRLGLGSVLGYLLAGIAIGPYVLSLVGNQSGVMHFAEFGVVMMLFLIGLDLQPTRLWQMRKSILGLGGLQVTLTATIITLTLLWTSSLQWQTVLAIGLVTSLSSTAIVLQSLSEKGLLKTQAGQNSFFVLLFQDIAVIPIIAFLPLLSLTSSGHNLDVSAGNLIAHLPFWEQMLIIISVMVGIYFGGKFIVNPVFGFVAQTQLREIFTAFALLLIIATASLMLEIGLSPALGTFLAGVVLADSEFRHELEIDLEPFKGLLLGLFFITVGSSINFHLVFQTPFKIFGLVIGLITIKAVVLLLLAKLFHIRKSQRAIFVLALAQGGEFAFVLVSLGDQIGVFTADLSNTINAVVAMSMLAAPLLLLINEFISKWFFKDERKTVKPLTPFESIEPHKVIIAGYGRFGQVTGRLLNAQGYELTILDNNPSRINLLKKYGIKIFYGDAARRELLKAAGAEEAELLVIAIDNPEKIMQIINIVKVHFPQLKILARAVSRRHAYDLIKEDIAGFRRDVFDSALNLGVDALKLLGNDPDKAERAGKLFADYDRKSLDTLAALTGDKKEYITAVKQNIEDLKVVLQADKDEEGILNMYTSDRDNKDK